MVRIRGFLIVFLPFYELNLSFFDEKWELTSIINKEDENNYSYNVQYVIQLGRNYL